MKKILLSIALLTAICSVSLAQTAASSSSAIGSGSFTAGIGIGTPFFGSGYSASLPVNPTITYEHTVVDAFSVGGTVSYASTKYSFADGIDNSFSLTESAIYIGARGSYHVGQLLNMGSNVDLYGGVSAGYVVVSVSDNQGDSASAASGVGYGFYAGLKYYFGPSVGVYAEAGYESLSYLNVGIAFKF